LIVFWNDIVSPVVPFKEYPKSSLDAQTVPSKLQVSQLDAVQVTFVPFSEQAHRASSRDGFVSK
jgi:hypothetical protein